MRHLGNRSLEKCLVSYRFVNIKLLHPEWRNFDRNDTRCLDTKEKFIFLILRFEFVPFFNLTNACFEPQSFITKFSNLADMLNFDSSSRRILRLRLI